MTDTNTTPKQAPTLQALVWYKEEDWETLRELFTDSHLLPTSYADWLQRAEEMIVKVEAAGDVALKVFIDPETFPAWCKEKGKEMDGNARADLAIEVATMQGFGSTL